MILFSQRMEIERRFLDWCAQNGVAVKPNSLVAFMEINGWLNEEAVIRDVPFKKLKQEITDAK